MKRENNKKFKKRKRNQNRSLTCRVLSMMFAIVLFCSTVLINTDYVSQASSFDDMVDMVEVEEDSAAADTSEDTGDDLDTDVNFESESEEGSAETYSESDDFGSSDADFSSGENMFTDGTSESSAPAEEAAQPVSCIVNLKNETIEVKAEAPAGVLPNGTQMIVKAVENNTEDAELTDQYKTNWQPRLQSSFRARAKTSTASLLTTYLLQMQMATRLNRPTKLLTALLIKKLLHRN